MLNRDTLPPAPLRTASQVDSTESRMLGSLAPARRQHVAHAVHLRSPIDAAEVGGSALEAALRFDFEGNSIYRITGNPEFEAVEMLRRRRALRKSLKIQTAVVRFWALLESGGGDSAGRASFDAYCAVHRSMAAVLAPDLTDAEARQAAVEDWRDDAGEQAQEISLQQFAQGLFSIADLWTDTVDERDYGNCYLVAARLDRTPP